jgi:Domain of unknown function (DUF4270)
MPIMIFMIRYFNSSQHTHRFVSVSQHLIKIFRLTLIALIAFLISSCEKKILNMGADLLPEGDFISLKAIDTLSVFSYTMYDDSVRSDNPSISFLGQISDPYFGTTTAEFVTQIRLKARWDGKPFAIDSVRLYLHLLTSRGGSESTHTLKLSELSEMIYPDSVYYSNRPVPVTEYDIPEIELPLLKADTINDVTLTLPVEFGNYLTRDTAKLYYEDYVHYSPDHPDFRSWFKGLYFQIKPSSDPLLTSIYLEPPVSTSTIHSASENALVIFMHDDLGVQKEFVFVLDAAVRNAAFSRFSHNYLTADPDKRIKHINDGYKDTLSYIQSLNGVFTRLALPGLKNIKNNPLFDKIAINKARLVVPVYLNGNQYKTTTVPPQLILKYKTSTGSRFVVPDWNIESINQTFYDGKLDTTARVYNFNIPAFVQSYLKDATNTVEPELDIFELSGTNNVILKANKSKTPIKFEFTYTKF